MENRRAPALSIITICRNRVSDIENTCRSVVEQTFENFEWIVIDGASTDGTKEILEKYSGKMAAFVSEPDSGIYNAMNKGIRMAKGERLLFLNGGDYLSDKDVLAKVFSRELLADICYGNVYHRDPGDDGLILVEAAPAEELSKIFFVHDTIFHQAAFIKRELFERFGLYNENYRIVSDWEKWIIFFENGCSFAKLDVAVSVFLLGGMSETQKKLRDGEVNAVHARHCTVEEVQRSLSRPKYTVLWSLGRWGIFSVLAIKETKNRRMRLYSFLNFSFLKVRLKSGEEIYRLFGLVPVWKRKKF